MNIECDKEKTIFRNEHNDKVFYSISMSKKDKEGNWQTGYVSKKDKEGNWQTGYVMCRFPKEADIPNKTKIKIHNAWLDFYLKEDKTMPYVFINKYEIIEDVEIPQNTKSNYAEDSDIQLDDNSLPF